MRVFSDDFLAVKKLGDDGGYDYRFRVSPGVRQREGGGELWGTGTMAVN